MLMLKLKCSSKNNSKIIKIDRIKRQINFRNSTNLKIVLIKTMKKLNEECVESFRDFSCNNGKTMDLSWEQREKLIHLF